MDDRIPRAEGGPGSRLERWLVRGLKSGCFEELPAYQPLREVCQRPELYARRLLDGLKEEAVDAWEQERLRDDGRAFRSWAETYPAVVLPVSS